MEKKMSWPKCIIGILFTFIFYLIISPMIIPRLLPKEILENEDLVEAIYSFVQVIIFILIVVAFGQKHRIGFTFKSFVEVHM